MACSRFTPDQKPHDNQNKGWTCQHERKAKDAKADRYDPGAGVKQVEHPPDQIAYRGEDPRQDGDGCDRYSI
jgi:hypothetical protein